jgi:hypothetical protein
MMVRNTALIALAALALVADAQSQPYDNNCVPNEEISRLRDLMLAATDQALKDHTVRLFDVWMKDPTDQPRRMIAGMRPAISAHVNARAALAKWKPPACEEKK